MGAYPTSPRAAFLGWCQAHQSVFTANAAQIGLTTAQATAFTNATTAAFGALIAQEQAKQAYRVATQQVEEAFGTLRSETGDTVRLIRAFAEISVNPSAVYNLAQIPPPATPSPMPPPGQPTNLTVSLDASDGALKLRWKVTNPPGAAGTSYIIRRRLPGASQFAFIGVSGKKEFVDDALIAGPDSVQYTVQGQRSDSSGPVSPIFTVNFGRLPGGAMTASVTQGAGGGESGGGGAYEASPSTVDGRVVQKVLPNAGGTGKARRERTQA